MLTFEREILVNATGSVSSFSLTNTKHEVEVRTGSPTTSRSARLSDEAWEGQQWPHYCQVCH